MKNDFQLAKELLAAKNVKRIFDCIDYDYVGMGEVEYNYFGVTLMEIVARFAQGFVVDICEKALKNNIALSEKQRWCIAYAFAKMTDGQIDEYEAYNNARLAELEAELEAETAAEETVKGESAQTDETMSNPIFTTEKPEETAVKYTVQRTFKADTAEILTTASESEARAEFDKHVQSLKDNTPADTSGWQDYDQAWSDVYMIELIETTYDEEGCIVNIETLDASDYYYL